MQESHATIKSWLVCKNFRYFYKKKKKKTCISSKYPIGGSFPKYLKNVRKIIKKNYIQ
jgi:hypothetical protein